MLGQCGTNWGDMTPEGAGEEGPSFEESQEFVGQIQILEEIFSINEAEREVKIEGFNQIRPEKPDQMDHILCLKDDIEGYLANGFLQRQPFLQSYQHNKQILARNLHPTMNNFHSISVIFFRFYIELIDDHFRPSKKSEELSAEQDWLIRNNQYIMNLSFWERVSQVHLDGLCVYLAIKCEQAQAHFRQEVFLLKKASFRLLMQGARQFHHGCILEAALYIKLRIQGIANFRAKEALKYRLAKILMRLGEKREFIASLESCRQDGPSQLKRTTQYPYASKELHLARIFLEKTIDIESCEWHLKKYQEHGNQCEEEIEELKRQIQVARANELKKQKFLVPSKIQRATMLASFLLRKNSKGHYSELASQQLQVLMIKNTPTRFIILDNIGPEYLVRNGHTSLIQILMVEEQELTLDREEAELLKHPGNIIEVSKVIIAVSSYETIFSCAINSCKIKHNKDKNKEEYSKVHQQEYLQACECLIEWQRTNIAQDMLQIIRGMDIETETLQQLQAQCELTCQHLMKAEQITEIVLRKNKKNETCKNILGQIFLALDDYCSATQTFSRIEESQYRQKMLEKLQPISEEQYGKRLNFFLFEAKKPRKIEPDYFEHPQLIRKHPTRSLDTGSSTLSRNFPELFNPIQLYDFLLAEQDKVREELIKQGLQFQDPIMTCLEYLRMGTQLSLTGENGRQIQTCIRIYCALFRILKKTQIAWDPIELLFLSQENEPVPDINLCSSEIWKGWPGQIWFNLYKYPYVTTYLEKLLATNVFYVSEYSALARRYFELCRFLELKANNFQCYRLAKEAAEVLSWGEDSIIQFGLKLSKLYLQEGKYQKSYSVSEKWLKRLEDSNECFYLTEFRLVKAETMKHGGTLPECQSYCLSILEDKWPALSIECACRFYFLIGECSYRLKFLDQALMTLQKIEGTYFEKECFSFKLVQLLLLIDLSHTDRVEAKINKSLKRYVTNPTLPNRITEAITLLKVKVFMLSTKYEEMQVKQEYQVKHQWEAELAKSFISVFLHMIRISARSLFQVLKVVKRFMYTKKQSFLAKLREEMAKIEELHEIVRIIEQKEHREYFIEKLNRDKKLRKMALKSLMGLRVVPKGYDLKKRIPQYFRPDEAHMAGLQPMEAAQDYEKDIEEFEDKMVTYQRIFYHLYQKLFVCCFALDKEMCHVILLYQNLSVSEEQMVKFLLEVYRRNMFFNPQNSRWELGVGDLMFLGRTYFELGCMVVYFDELKTIGAGEVKKEAEAKRRIYQDEWISYVNKHRR